MQLALDTFHRAAAVGAFAQQHQAGDHFAYAICGYCAITGQCAEAHAGNIFDANGCASARGDSHIANVISIAQLPHGAHQQHFVTAIDAVAAGIAVAVGQRMFNVIQTQAMCGQLRRDGHHFKGAHFTAQRIYVRSAFHGTQARPYHPVLQGA